MQTHLSRRPLLHHVHTQKMRYSERRNSPQELSTVQDSTQVDEEWPQRLKETFMS